MQTSKKRRVLFWSWTGVTAIAGLVWALTSDDVSGGVALALIAAWFTALGSLIALRRPGNRVSWLLLVVGFSLLFVSAANPVVSSPPSSWSAGLLVLVALANLFAIFGIFYPVSLLLFIFPNGRFLNRRWSWPAWVGVVLIAAGLTTYLFSRQLVWAYGSWSISNPIGFIPSGFQEVYGVVAGVSMFLMTLGGVVSTIVRYRRSSHLVRTQIKWLLYAAMILALAYPLLLFGAWEENPAMGLIFLGSLAVFPLAVTVAITQYRLYEIDRIISRTFGYLLVVAALGSVYAIGAVWLPSRLVQEQPPIFVAGSTLAVAALFNPLRRRTLVWVDRRFYRSRYDTQQLVEAFSDRLRHEFDVSELTRAGAVVVAEALHPVVIGIWVKAPNEG